MSEEKKDPEEKIVMTLRVPRYLRENFVKTAKAQDDDGSKVLRRFMREYIKKNNQPSLKGL